MKSCLKNIDKTIAFFMLVLPLVGICGWLNLRYFGEPYSPMAESSFYINKVYASADYDLVMCGNSRMLQGLSPEAMNEELPGVRILNLGLDGACLTPQMYTFIKGKIDPASSTPMILLGIEPGTLEEYSSSNRKLNVELGRSSESQWLARHGDEWVKWFAPLRPFKIMNRMSLWLRGPTLAQPYYHQEFHPSGWKAGYQEPENLGKHLKKYRVEHGITDEDRMITPLPYKAVLLEQTKTWSDEGILVFGVRIPAAKELREHEDFRFDFSEEKVSRAFEAAGGIWISTAPARYHSFDGSHLHKDSAIAFSHDVAGTIKRRLTKEK